MVSSKVIPLRASPDEHDAWRRAAGSKSFNSWARSALNQAARLDAALQLDEAADESLVERARVASERLKRSGRKCVCPGMRVGSWCKRCGVVR